MQHDNQSITSILQSINPNGFNTLNNSANNYNKPGILGITDYNNDYSTSSRPAFNPADFKDFGKKEPDFNFDRLGQGIGIGKDILLALSAIQQFKMGKKALNHSIALDKANLANQTAITQADLATLNDTRNSRNPNRIQQPVPTLQGTI